MRVPFLDKGLLGRKRTKPQIDRSMGDARVAVLEAHLTNADWAATREILAAEKDPDELWFLIDAAAEVTGVETWLPDVIEKSDDVLPTLLFGARAIHWAWEARTSYSAKYVTPDRWRIFGQRIAIAEDCLLDVITRDPRNVTAHSLRLVTSRALSHGVAETRSRFERVIELHPEHFQAHIAMLSQLLPRWGGSFDELHAFARDTVEAAPAGSPLVRLVAQAHVEHWFELNGNGTYLWSQRVRDEIREAAARIDTSAPITKPWWSVYNVFALAFHLIEDHRASAWMFNLLGDRATEYPWQLLGEDPAKKFREVRAAVRRY